MDCRQRLSNHGRCRAAGRCCDSGPLAMARRTLAAPGTAPPGARDRAEGHSISVADVRPAPATQPPQPKAVETLMISELLVPRRRWLLTREWPHRLLLAA